MELLLGRHHWATVLEDLLKNYLVLLAMEKAPNFHASRDLPKPCFLVASYQKIVVFGLYKQKLYTL